MTRRRRTILTVAILLVVLVVVPGLVLTPGVRHARLAARQSNVQCAASQIGLGMWNYHEVYGCFPPAYTVDNAGRREHSWRALLAPWVELPGGYRYDEPWDSESNRRFLEASRNPFRGCGRSGDDPHTHFFVVEGPRTAFPGTGARSYRELKAHTVLLVHSDDLDIIWTEPRDITPDDVLELFRQYKQRYYSWKRFINPVGRGPCVVLADGRVRRLHHEMTEEYVRSVLELPPDPLGALAADAAVSNPP